MTRTGHGRQHALTVPMIAGLLTTTPQVHPSNTSHEARRSEDSRPYCAALEPRRRISEAVRESSAESKGELRMSLFQVKLSG